MIYALKGILFEKQLDFVVIEVCGVFYRVNLFQNEIKKLDLNSEVFVYTYFFVSRDMDFVLYGFADKNDISLFELLIGVSGIGPKTAFSILAFKGSTNLINAIKNADKSFFKPIKGVGEKQALKIIVDLQSKVGKVLEINLAPNSKEDSEILEALSSMGYARDVCSEILSTLSKDLSEQEKIKKIISQISKK